MAKIKPRDPYAQDRHRHKPRNVSHKAFERVYWPYIPLVLAIALLLPAAWRSGALKHPSVGKVLSYSISESPNAMLIDTNKARRSEGQPLLQINDQLSRAAESKAQDMANRDYWSHDTPDGIPPWTFVTSTGYSYQKLGENLASGFSDEQSVINAWMASAAHRENMIDPAFTQVGFGFANIPNYKAAGGGPMTLVVAFYGEPSGTIPLASVKPVDTSHAPSSANLISGQALGASAGRAQVAFASQAAIWAPVALILGALAVLALFLGRHAAGIRRSVRRGEQFVWRHPLFDLGLAVVAGLLVLLSQTVGYIN